MKDNRIYTGHTNNIIRRFYQHYIGNGSQTTKNFGVQYLTYLETHKTKKEAYNRELRIKSFQRNVKLNMIRNNNDKKILEEISNLIINSNTSNLKKQIQYIINNINTEYFFFLFELIINDKNYLEYIS